MKRFAVITLALWAAILWAGPAAAQSSGSQSGAAKADDPLVVGIDPGFPPFAILTMDGRPAGLLVDIWRLWSTKTGRKIEFRAADWNTLMDDLRSGGIDVVFGLFRSKKRDKWIDFSQPFYESGSRLFFPTELAQEPSLDSLAGEKVGTVKGTFQEGFLRENHPKVEVVPMATTEKLLEAMLAGTLKAFVSEDLITDHLVSRLGLQGEVEEGSAALFRKKLHAGIEKGRSELLAVIDKGFNAITNDELLRIEQRWIRDPNLRFFRAGDTKIRLTEAEEAWLRRHKSVRVMVGTWPPFHYVEDDKNKGLALDYVRKILGDLGLELKPVRILWADALSSISKLEKLDLLPTIARSKEREKLVNITRDYLSFPSVIVTRKEGDAIGSLKDLYGRKVAVENNFIMHKRLARDHPAIEIDPRKTTKDALSAVSLGQATAYVGNLAVASYLIEKFGFANLKIAAQTDYAHDTQAIGVRRDWPELASMINKSLAAITEAEHAALREKALSVSLVTGLDATTVAKWGGGIGAVVVVVIVVFALWTRRLGREIAERNRAERESAEQTALLEKTMENMGQGIALFDKDRHLLAFNHNYQEVLELPDDLLTAGQTIDPLVDYLAGQGFYGPGDTKALAAERIAQLFSGKSLSSEFTNSKQRTYLVVTHPTEDGGFVITYSDITQRKQAEVEISLQKSILEATMDSMDEGIVMFDADYKLVACNSKVNDFVDLPERFFEKGVSIEDWYRYVAERGEYGSDDAFGGNDVEAQVEARMQSIRDGAPVLYERELRDGRIVEIRRNSVADGGFVSTYTDITDRKTAENELHDRFEELEQFNKLAVGRELRMIELKQQINEILQGMGKDPEYEIVE